MRATEEVMRLSANTCKHNPKQVSVTSLLSEQVQHHGLQVVPKGAGSRHQPMGAEAGMVVHHAGCYVGLQQQRGQRRFYLQTWSTSKTSSVIFDSYLKPLTRDVWFLRNLSVTAAQT